MKGKAMFESWTDGALAKIGLERQQDAIAIVIPSDTNLYHLTVGAQIAAGHADALALVFETADGCLQSWTFGDVDAQATSLAADLRERGYGRGDYIGLHTGMRPETAIAHMAICKLGATAVTLSQLYGPEALAHALNHCKARCILSSEDAWGPLRSQAETLLPHVVDVLVANCDGSETDLMTILTTPPPADFVPD
jgi:acetyl-CoA synthetase